MEIRKAEMGDLPIILEIYADQEAYQSHIQTAHFKKYKEGTLKMVKSLKLIDTTPLTGMKKWME
jgi:quinol monooxygenase YgiN